MMVISKLIEAIEDGLPVGAVSRGEPQGIGITDVDLNLPVETRIRSGGELLLSMPRGRLATGYDIPHGRLRLTFTRGNR